MMTWVLWNFVFIRLETVLVSVENMCMVCAKYTIGSKIIWTHPMALLRFKAQLEAHLGPFGDSANLDAR
jgi:hypothetical protein